jgi:hypothetical protein
MGEFTIRVLARLGWVPMWIYRNILGRMVQLGILIKSVDPDDEFPRYLLARVARKHEGGRMKDDSIFILPPFAFRLSKEGGGP